jgi:hypothetical protein
MKRLKIGRPSPAIIVAVAALVAALAGTAIADPGASVSKINRAKVKKISQKQARKVITQEAPNLTVGAANNLTNLEYVRSSSTTVAPSANGSAIATCPSGKFVTGGGGAGLDVSGAGLTEVASHPSNGTQGQLGYTAWEYRVHNASGSPHTINAYAVCASLKPGTGQNPTPSNYNNGSVVP